MKTYVRKTLIALGAGFLLSNSIAASDTTQLPRLTVFSELTFTRSLRPHRFGTIREALLANTTQTSRKKRRIRKPDVIYYPTPPETVAEMLRLANIQKGEVLYDLGSGDGRIPIAAARQFGIRGVGIEIDPKLVTEAKANALSAGVSELVRFRNEDMFRIDVSEASVVTLYLSEKLNVLLRPKLLRELRPGSRIVSHDFRMGDWKPEQTVRVPWGKLYRTVYLWTVPTRSRAKRRAI